jgi:hypothetical protein
MIEMSYGIRIHNFEDVAARISASIDNPQDVIMVTTVLNSYVAQCSSRPVIHLPEEIIGAAIAASRFLRRSGA